MISKIFLFPGRLLAELEFLFPGKGQLWASARRAESGLVHGIYSTIFWVGAATLLSMGVFHAVPTAGHTPETARMARDGAQEPVYQSSVAQVADDQAGDFEELDLSIETASPAEPPARPEPLPFAAKATPSDEEDLRGGIVAAFESGQAERWTSALTGRGGYVAVSEGQDYRDMRCRNYTFTEELPDGIVLTSQPDRVCRHIDGTFSLDRHPEAFAR